MRKHKEYTFRVKRHEAFTCVRLYVNGKYKAVLTGFNVNQMKKRLLSHYYHGGIE